jgi:hypothetical protein
VPSFVLLSVGNELPMGFPRYHYPVFLLMALTVSLWLGHTVWPTLWMTLRRKPRYKLATPALLASITLAAALYFALLIPDPLLPQYALTFETQSLAQRLRFALQSQMLALALPWAAIGLVARVALSQQIGRIALTTRITCIAFCLASWPVMDVAQALAPYSTIYEYGRVGGQEMADWVRAHTELNALVVAPKEVTFAAERQGTFIIELAGPDATAQAWLEYFKSQRPAAYILTTKEDTRYTQVTRDAQVLAYLDACYPERFKVGSYLAYARSGPCN